MDLLVDLFVTSCEIFQLLDNPLEISNGCGGPPISNRVDPQNAIPFGQPKHDVLLAKGIAVPIVAEADDVFAFDHIFLT